MDDPTMALPVRVAIGPFALTDAGATWPLRDCESLRPHYEVLPFGPGEPPPEAEAVVWWSPEYGPAVPGFLDHPGLRVLVYGDWHVVPFEDEVKWPLLQAADLVTADWRGVRRLQDLGLPAARLLWWRQFSFDPRLHYCPTGDAPRPIDVAFCGRPDGGPRAAALERLVTLCARQGWSHQVQTQPYARGVEATIYRQAKLVFNRSARGELNMRCYEAAACGALSLIELQNSEVYAAQAPLVRWQESTLEAQLEAWVTDDDARAVQVERQRAWVATETPAAHLRWLCRQLAARVAARPRAAAAHMPAFPLSPPSSPPSSPSSPSSSGPAAVPASEQRAECAALVPTTARSVLDIGCGRGGFGAGLQAYRPPVQVVGVDCDAAAVAVARTRLAAAHVFDVDRWQGGEDQAWQQPGAYDCITCLDVLEHLIDPGRALQRLRGLLRPDGCLVASIPNALRNATVVFDQLVGNDFRYYRAGRDPCTGPAANLRAADHLRWWTFPGLQRLFAESGYALEEEYQGLLMDNQSQTITRWVADIAYLIAVHGGDAEAWKREALVYAWLVRARPDWRIGVPAG